MMRTRGTSFADSASTPPPDDLEAAFERLLSARDPRHIRAWLEAFDGAPLPSIPPFVLDLIAQSDPVHLENGLVEAASDALANVTDEGLRQQALSWLSAPPTPLHIPLAIILIRSSYQPGDAHRIHARLPVDLHRDANIREGYEISNLLHGIGFALLDLAEAIDLQEDDGLTKCLLWLYEFGPCSMCRRLAVEQLLARGVLGDGVREECALDSDADTRELFV